MQSRAYTQNQLHQYRQSAALLTQSEADRRTFLDGLLEDADLCEGARRSFLYQLKNQGVSAAVFELAAEDSLCITLRAAFRRLDALLTWDAAKGDLATWWGRQALFEFNNDGRRQAEKSCGYSRGTDEWFQLLPTSVTSEEGELVGLTLVDPRADPAERVERAAAGSMLHSLLHQAQDVQAALWLQDWLAADALHDDTPLNLTVNGPRLTWKYGAQQQVAAREGVSDRTLRSRARRVESMLSGVMSNLTVRPSALPGLSTYPLEANSA